jgi:hypothetical protein
MAKQRRGKPGGGGKKKSCNDDANDDANDNHRCRRSRRHHHRTACDDGDGDDAKFRNALLDQGKIIIEMKADGNCLFRSLSDQLYDDRGDKHDVVRREICEYLSENRKEFENFLLMDDDDEDVLGMEGYIGRMRKVRMRMRGIALKPFILLESTCCSYNFLHPPRAPPVLLLRRRKTHCTGRSVGW